MASASDFAALQAIDNDIKSRYQNDLREAANVVGSSTTSEVLESSGLSLEESFERAKGKFDEIVDDWVAQYPRLENEIRAVASFIYVNRVNAAW